jgi:hypothetical protein
LLVLAAIGGLAFVLGSLVVGGRLLLLARRTRQLPEALIGLALFLLGGIGYPLLTIWQALDAAPRLQVAVCVAHAVLNLVGQSAQVFFAWLVFRRLETWAGALCAVYTATIVGLFVWQTVAPGWSEFVRTGAGPWRWLMGHILFSLGWMTIEPLLYYAKLRKRLALGLADPVTTDRLRLWGFASLCALLTTGISLILQSSGVAMTLEVTGLFVGPLGVLSAAAMWLAFIPPQRYLDWVLAHAGTEA